MFEVRSESVPKSELEDEVRAFFPDGDGAPALIEQNSTGDKKLSVEISIDGRKFFYEHTMLSLGGEAGKREYKRFNKRCLYDALSELTGRSLPWGSLTGVRPTKLAYELIKEGKSIDGAVKSLVDFYRVSEKKAELIGKILKAQQGIYEESENKINLYVHIPFCVSRCSYCSFITDVLTPSYRYMDSYVDALIEEISRTKDLLAATGRSILSVYIGGGTPTALNAASLKRVLEAARSGNVEFTCEAGRPDTVTYEKLEVMADCGVTRICVNPQSLCDTTLERIGRKHTAADFFAAYESARKFPFRINTDLIAGLEGEGIAEFSHTLSEIAGLRPENVTVHTLSRKNGSSVRLSGYKENDAVESMVHKAHETLSKCGYEPYYMYRQKRMLGNLENTGYSLIGKECVNNITTMEECVGVAACGAGAISKRIFASENRIERLANLRDVKLYLEQFEARLNKKLIFLT